MILIGRTRESNQIRHGTAHYGTVIGRDGTGGGKGGKDIEQRYIRECGVRISGDEMRFEMRSRNKGKEKVGVRVGE